MLNSPFFINSLNAKKNSLNFCNFCSLRKFLLTKALNGLVQFNGLLSVWAGFVWRKLQPTASGSTVLSVMRNI